GDRQGGDQRRRAGDGAHRPRSDAAGPQALELPRPPPSRALRPAHRARPTGDARMTGSMTVDTIVRGGQVVTPDGVDDFAIAIAGGKIVALGEESMLPRGDRVLDAAGKI